MVESSDKTCSTAEGQTTSAFFPWEPTDSMKRLKDTTLKVELSGFVDAQNATGEEWRNNSRRNEEAELK